MSLWHTKKPPQQVPGGITSWSCLQKPFNPCGHSRGHGKWLRGRICLAAHKESSKNPAGAHLDLHLRDLFDPVTSVGTVLEAKLALQVSSTKKEFWKELYRPQSPLYGGFYQGTSRFLPLLVLYLHINANTRCLESSSSAKVTEAQEGGTNTTSFRHLPRTPPPCDGPHGTSCLQLLSARS